MTSSRASIFIHLNKIIGTVNGNGQVLKSGTEVAKGMGASIQSNVDYLIDARRNQEHLKIITCRFFTHQGLCSCITRTIYPQFQG